MALNFDGVNTNGDMISYSGSYSPPRSGFAWISHERDSADDWIAFNGTTDNTTSAGSYTFFWLVDFDSNGFMQIFCSSQDNNSCSRRWSTDPRSTTMRRWGWSWNGVMTTSPNVYFNGAADNGTGGTGTGTPVTAKSITAMGGRDNDNRNFDGSIAEFALWSVELTAAEHAILGAGYPPILVRPQSLVFYAPLVRNYRDIKGGLNATVPTGHSTPTFVGHPGVIGRTSHLRQAVAAAAAPGLSIPIANYYYQHAIS